MKQSILSTGLALLWLSFVISPAFAHPVPESDFDRAIVAEVRTDSVIIEYTLEINEFTLLNLVADPEYRVYLRPTGKLSRQDIADALLKRLEALIPDGLILTQHRVAAGSPSIPRGLESLKLQPLSGEVTFGDSVKFSVRCVLRYNHVPFNLLAKYELQDENFKSKNGRLAIRFEPIAPLELESRNDLADKRRTADSTEPAKATISIRRTPTEDDLKPVGKKINEVHPRLDADPPTLFELLVRALYEDSLTPLLDNPSGLWLVLLVAFTHGMAHSLAPGHGKTLVAAYLVGERGTSKHAVILGIVVTLTHTATAFAVALALRFVFPDAPPRTVQGLLGCVGGLLIAGIGVWLLVSRLSGASASGHSHGHGHSHGEGHGHSHGPSPEEFAKVSTPRLIMLGISGGIIPCWGAVLWVLYCVTAHRPGFAVWTLLAFGLGLAVVLIGLGITVAWGNRRIDNRPGLRSVGRWISIAGAVLVACMGIMICKGNMGLLVAQ